MDVTLGWQGRPVRLSSSHRYAGPPARSWGGGAVVKASGICSAEMPHGFALQGGFTDSWYTEASLIRCTRRLHRFALHGGFTVSLYTVPWILCTRRFNGFAVHEVFTDSLFLETSSICPKSHTDPPRVCPPLCSIFGQEWVCLVCSSPGGQGGAL